MSLTLAPESVEFPPEVYITPFSRSGVWANLAALSIGAPVSSNLNASAGAYLPIFIPRTVIATRLFAINGATAGGTNTRDLGIYRSDSNRLPSTLIVSSGGVAISGANVGQYVDIADTTLVGPALYYVGIVHSGTTDTVLRALITVPMNAPVRFHEPAAHPLPSTAAPITSAANTVPVCGITLRASP